MVNKTLVVYNSKVAEDIAKIGDKYLLRMQYNFSKWKRKDKIKSILDEQ